MSEIRTLAYFEPSLSWNRAHSHPVPGSLFLEIFEGVPQFEVRKNELETGVSIVDFLAVNTSVFTSKGEARKMIQGGGVSVNKIKLEDINQKPDFALLQNKYLLAQKGKKNYYLIVVE